MISTRRSQMEVNKKITKIVVNKEDEITDVVAAIVDSVNQRIVLTFAEDSDLLISPINLRVILETADEKEKLLITQIIKNPTGVRNASLAGLYVTESPNLPTEDMWEDEEINRTKRLSQQNNRTTVPTKLEKEQDTRQDIPQTSNTSDFQKRIDDAMKKTLKEDKHMDKKDDEFLIAVDSDIPITYENENTENISFQKEDHKIDKKGRKNPLVPKIKNFFTKLKVKFSSNKIYPIVLISVVLVAILSAVVYYFTAPFVRVNIYIKGKEVSIEKVFEGDQNIKEIDFQNMKIPIKKESVEKSSSTTISATGVAYKGDKAKGLIRLTFKSTEGCKDVEPIQIPAGTVVIAKNEGKSYTTDSSVSVQCNQTADVNITASEVGEEYNLPMGTFFVVQGFESEKIYGGSSQEIAGGTKKEYRILTQADVNSGVESLKKNAYEEGEREMKDKSGGTWELIPESLNSEVLSNSIETSKKIGEEADQVDLSLKIRTTATFYMKEGFDNGVAELLKKEAEEKNLFEKENNLELALGDDISKEITVIQNDNNGVKVKLTAKASVKPKINKDEIISQLKNMSWTDGNQYLKNLSYSEKETEVEFNPKNFPDKLKYFPKKQGGILIEVKETF
ncbi:MAG TPA: baseplate J/gp47 family protein [Candidatus Dojkabacteria bacterium]|nr:baseplate J/gp47 family protein [Candidatus Dojkabacteria bacterium]